MAEVLAGEIGATQLRIEQVRCFEVELAEVKELTQYPNKFTCEFWDLLNCVLKIS